MTPPPGEPAGYSVHVSLRPDALSVDRDGVVESAGLLELTLEYEEPDRR